MKVNYCETFLLTKLFMHMEDVYNSPDYKVKRGIKHMWRTVTSSA